MKTFWAFAHDEKGWLGLWGGILAASLVLGPLAWFGLGPLVAWLGFQGGDLPDWQLWMHALGFALGVASVFAWGRYGAPRLETLKSKATRRSELERNRRTDVREISKHLPDAGGDYDPQRYINTEKGIFIGLDEQKRPLYLPVALWQRSHAQLIGTTGAGKGVASGLLLSQALQVGEAVIVMDPKNDEWAPHVLRSECERLGLPFYLVDLRHDAPQIDLIDGATPDELEEMLVAGFSLAEKGEAADFYRIGDRSAARLCGGLLRTFAPDAGVSIAELAKQPDIRKQAKDAAGFVGKLDELARVTAISCPGAGLLSRVVASGGCVYVIGSMRNERVRMAQRMLLVRLLQIVETRDRINSKPRPVCCFLDELKYHLSRPALEGLGAARDKGLHLVLAHQSLADLRDCPADLDGEAVVGAVVENCALRIAYRVRDPETAEWLGSMSGKILVDDETRRIERNAGLAEVIDSERSVRQAERYLVDENMLLNLPDRVAVVYGKALPMFAHICPVRAEKAALQRVDEVAQREAEAEQAYQEARAICEEERLQDDRTDEDREAEYRAMLDEEQRERDWSLGLNVPAAPWEPVEPMPEPKQPKPTTIRGGEFPDVDF
ncbi:type IV secretory system conjugative DNA transfer family protein [Pseudomonas aeruginosa]